MPFSCYYDPEISEPEYEDSENDLFEIPEVMEEIIFNYENHTCNQCYCYFPKTNDNAYIEKYTCHTCLTDNIKIIKDKLIENNLINVIQSYLFY